MPDGICQNSILCCSENATQHHMFKGMCQGTPGGTYCVHEDIFAIPLSPTLDHPEELPNPTARWDPAYHWLCKFAKEHIVYISRVED